MPFTYEMQLPTIEELTVNEVNIGMAALFAGALQLGKVCESSNNEFILCRKETGDPRQCIQEGKEVTKCALNFFRQIKKECRKEFEDFATCLHKGSCRWDYGACRNTQTIFDKCVLDKLGLDKPPNGWCAEAHIHKTERAKPDDTMVFLGAPDKYEPEKNVKPSKHGVRTRFS